MRRLILFCLILLAGGIARAQPPPAEDTPRDCAALLDLIDQGISPYDLARGGGILPPGEATTATMPAGHYMDTWLLSVTQPANAAGTTLDSQLTVTFERAALDLEYAVYDGMDLLAPVGASRDFSPVEPGTTATYPVTRSTVLTLVVRQREAGALQAGDYSVQADYVAGDTLEPRPLRDETSGGSATDAPTVTGGHVTVRVNDVAFQTHAGSAIAVATRDGRAAQIFFDGESGLLVNEWADDVSLLGGDLAVRGVTSAGRPRLLYVEDYGYTASVVDGDLLSVTDGDGTRWRLDWSVINGVWIREGCAGARLDGGRVIVGTLDETRPRDVRFTGTLDDFQVALSSGAGFDFNHTLAMQWDGIRPDVPVSWYDTTLTIDYLDDRRLVIDAPTIDLQATDQADPDRPPRLDIMLAERDRQIILDWRDITTLSIGIEQVQIDYDDTVRTTTTRSAVDLRLFESLDGVTRIDYAPGSPVDELLLLPAEDSYIEILTPGDPPAFDGRARPGERDYAPRGLNNTGGECYPLNTLQPAANCPANGEINPANGNLRLAILDHLAYGGEINLSMTRAYNSTLAAVDGPLGQGWTTPFRLDYAVAYDESRNSRLVTPEVVADFPVGLDVTYAPQGIVTFFTPSGSHHTFVSDDPPPYVSGTLRAITQPGWTLQRASVRDLWTLTQADGLTYEFDRAGRILRYGYPRADRWISVDYPGGSLTGTGAQGTQPVVISDAAGTRRLELTFDGTRIRRSALCDADTCQTADYTYTEGRLTQVDYSDGSRARYSYDALGRLTEYDDPRAPTITRARFDYLGEVIRINALMADGGAIPWRTLSAPVIDGDRLSRTLTDAYERTQTFTYAYTPGALRTPAESYTLLAETSPLAGTSAFESEPITYTWESGRLVSQPRRSVTGGNVGRNSIFYDFNPAGSLTRIRGGLPETSIDYDAANRPITIRYADGTTEAFSYDETGDVVSYRTRTGGQITFTSDAQGRIRTATDQTTGIVRAYRYNALGLVETTTQYRVDDDPATAYVITTEYDALGRPVTVTDSLDDRHTITYQAGADGQTISTTDVTATTTTARYSHNGRLLEQRIHNAAGPLRVTTYDYDALGRQITESRLAEPTTPTFYTTRYRYAALPVLDSIGDPATINGYQITVTDAYDRTQIYTYDALDRIRQVETATNALERYDYAVADDPDNNPNGLEIRERRALGDQVYLDRTYRFDLAWQLREIERGDALWEIVPTFPTIQPEILQARRANIASGIWGDFVNGRPAGLTINPLAPPLPSGAEAPSISLEATYDGLGRPTTLTQTDGSRQTITYCTTPGGGLRTIYSIGPTDCDRAALLTGKAITQDPAGRLIRVEIPGQSRAYTYTPEDGIWRVTMTVSTGETWALTYNGVGDLLAWTDADGFRRDYSYDTLGRLQRVMVADQPQASLTYTYNAADRVTQVIDDAGNGTRYDYDTLGRLIVAQDIRNANATVYGYNAANLLATVISPLGNTTAFLYEDQTDPTRLTGVISPTGATATFDWDDFNNGLTYTDPRGNMTRYRFDAFGALWRVDDALGQTHELQYDAAGLLNSWRQSQTEAGAARQIDLTPGDTSVTLTAPGLVWQTRFDYDDTTLTALDDIQLTTDSLGRVTAIRTFGGDWTLNYPPGTPTLSLTGPDDATTTWTYDALNRLLSETVNGIRTADLRYDDTSAERDVQIIDTDAARLTRDPGDATTRPTSLIIRTSGTRRTVTFTAEGLVDEIIRETCMDAGLLADESLLESDACLRLATDQIWRQTERVRYDFAGRPVRVIDTEQNIETLAYDDAGNLVNYQDVDGRSFDYAYDALNRLTSITGPTGIRLLLDYDAGGAVQAICRARAETATTYADCATDPTRIVETYRYDVLGRLVERRIPTDDEPITTTFSYENIAGPILEWNDGAVTVLYEVERNLGLVGQINIGVTNVPYLIEPTIDGPRIRQGDDFRATYDVFGRLVRMYAPVASLGIEYSDEQLVISDLDQDSGLIYRFDDRDALVAIESLLSLQYFLNPDGRILVTDITRADDQLIQLQRNRLEAVQNIAYFDSDLLTDIVTTPGGLIQRESLIGAPRYFVEDTQDYIIVAGFDNDGRPLTLRISDRANGERLYLHTLTYSPLGVRETETQQYRDGTQVTIVYTTDPTDHIIEQSVTITRPDADDGDTTAMRGLSLGGMMLLFGLAGMWRRRIAVSVMIAGLLIGLALGLTTAQSTERTVYNYQYDTAGNLTTVRADGRVCTRYNYDEANRLTMVRDGLTIQRRYAYDAQNRLTGIDDVTIRYAGEHPIVAQTTDAMPRWYGSTDDLSAFFQVEGDQIDWLYHDGHGDLMALGDAGDTTAPLWLYDPLGRYLTLQPPDADRDPCQPAQPPSALAALSPLPAFQPGMLWDPVTGLYFDEGRAYAPQIGAYLQRDRHGPDAFGTLYLYPAQRTAPPVRERPPAYTEGLTRLSESLAQIRRAQTLTPDVIIARHLPAIDTPPVAPALETLIQREQTTRAASRRLLDAPLWFLTNYNLPGAFRAGDGTLTRPDHAMPGRGGLNTTIIETDLTFSDPVLPEIRPPVGRLAHSQPSPTHTPLTTYAPFAWMPAQPSVLTLAEQMPHITERPRPAAAWEWLPDVLRQPEAAAPLLDAVVQLDDLPRRTTFDWWQMILAALRPAYPALPPDTIDSWLSRWFTTDTLGIDAALSATWPDVPPLDLPGVTLGFQD